MKMGVYARLGEGVEDVVNSGARLRMWIKTFSQHHQHQDALDAFESTRGTGDKHK